MCCSAAMHWRLVAWKIDYYRTSLGYALRAGHPVAHGHEHHLRTINRIRSVGSMEGGGAPQASSNKA